MYVPMTFPDVKHPSHVMSSTPLSGFGSNRLRGVFDIPPKRDPLMSTTHFNKNNLSAERGQNTDVTSPSQRRHKT